MRWTELATPKIEYIIKEHKYMSIDYNERQTQSRGSIDTEVDVVDVHNNKIDRRHSWEIYAVRNIGGMVMFMRDGEPYYVYDCDVYWFD